MRGGGRAERGEQTLRGGFGVSGGNTAAAQRSASVWERWTRSAGRSQGKTEVWFVLSSASSLNLLDGAQYKRNVCVLFSPAERKLVTGQTRRIP